MNFQMDYLVPPGGRAPDAATVAAALARVGAVANPAGEWTYDNPLTRAACRWGPVAAGAPADGAPARSDPVLRFSGPLPRAGFVARETLPPAAAAAQSLQLWVAPAGGVQRDHALSELFDAWAAKNRSAVAALRAAGRDPAYLPQERAAYWWEYATGRADLRLTWPSPDIHVPDLVLLQRRDGGRVELILIWPEEAGALIVPAADRVLFRRRGGHLSATASAPADLVPLPAVLAELGGRVQPHSAPVRHWLYRGGEAHPFTFARLRALTGDPARLYAPVAPDQFVDVPGREEGPR